MLQPKRTKFRKMQKAGTAVWRIPVIRSVSVNTD